MNLAAALDTADETACSATVPTMGVYTRMRQALALLASEVRSGDPAGELLSLSTLPSFVHLGGDVWVNPAFVVAVGPASDADRALFGSTSVELITGATHHCDRAVIDVLAMLTGDRVTS